MKAESSRVFPRKLAQAQQTILWFESITYPGVFTFIETAKQGLQYARMAIIFQSKAVGNLLFVGLLEVNVGVTH